MAITALGMAGIGAGQTLLNQGLGMINQGSQSRYNKEQARYQQKLDKETMKYSYDLTNTTAMMKQLKANNLNPTLAMGGGGAAGQTVSTGNSSANGVGMIDNKVGMQDAAQLSLMEAQKENIEADTKQKLADANTKDATRPYQKELLKQQSTREWIDNNRKLFTDRTNETGEEQTWNYNEVLDREHMIESGSLFGRQMTQDVLKAIADTGNVIAQTILTNKKAEGYFRELANQTILAEAAKQNADTNKENLANEKIKALAAKLTAEYGAGEVMNAKQVIELASTVIKSLAAAK